MLEAKRHQKDSKCQAEPKKLRIFQRLFQGLRQQTCKIISSIKMNFGKYEYSASVKRTHLYSLRFFLKARYYIPRKRPVKESFLVQNLYEQNFIYLKKGLSQRRFLKNFKKSAKLSLTKCPPTRLSGSWKVSSGK